MYTSSFTILRDDNSSNPSSIDTSISGTINSYWFSFFINSPFLWNDVPFNIIQITDPKLFRVALRRFLFKLNVALYLSAIVLFYLLFLYLCIVLVSCTVLSFWGARLQAQPFV